MKIRKAMRIYQRVSLAYFHPRRFAGRYRRNGRPSAAPDDPVLMFSHDQPARSTGFHPVLLSDGQLREIACEYMEHMGCGEQPYIVFKHKNISRKHLHIMSLRVDEQNCKLPHDFEARCSMEILPDLERKYGLHPSVKGQKLTDTPGLRKVNYKAENVKLQISSVVRSCLRSYKCSSYGEFRTWRVFSMVP